MQNRVEPPILLSRVLTFVLAGAVVVLATLWFTLNQLFPLSRPQVFFLTTQVRADLEIKLEEMPPRDEYLNTYKHAFVREYIKARNEVVQNPREMQAKWSSDGVVRTWSTDDVYVGFAATALWDEIMNGIPEIGWSCPVEFHPNAISPRGNDTYAVRFRYFCADNNGQVHSKDYTIKIKLISDGGDGIKWADRLENPLGLRVAEYTIESGNGDPLDTGFLAAE